MALKRRTYIAYYIFLLSLAWRPFEWPVFIRLSSSNDESQVARSSSRSLRSRRSPQPDIQSSMNMMKLEALTIIFLVVRSLQSLRLLRKALPLAVRSGSSSGPFEISNVAQASSRDLLVRCPDAAQLELVPASNSFKRLRTALERALDSTFGLLPPRFPSKASS